MSRLLFALLGSIVIGSSVEAATLQIDGSGQLTGASAVEIGGELFDISFGDRSCAEAYTGCDEASDFILGSFGQLSIISSVRSQIFSGTFATAPSRVAGCSSSTRCSIFIPLAPLTTVSYRTAGIRVLDSGARGFTGAASIALDLSTEPDRTLLSVAPHNPAPAPIPLPASFPLMLLGLIGLTWFRRSA